MATDDMKRECGRFSLAASCSVFSSIELTSDIQYSSAATFIKIALLSLGRANKANLLQKENN